MPISDADAALRESLLAAQEAARRAGDLTMARSIREQIVTQNRRLGMFAQGDRVNDPLNPLGSAPDQGARLANMPLEADLLNAYVAAGVITAAEAQTLWTAYTRSGAGTVDQTEVARLEAQINNTMAAGGVQLQRVEGGPIALTAQQQALTASAQAGTLTFDEAGKPVIGAAPGTATAEAGTAGGTAGAGGAPTAEPAATTTGASQVRAAQGTVAVGTTTLPDAGQLYRVAQSIYSDEATYYLVYDINGVKVSYEIGNLPEAQRLLGANFREQLGGFVSISQINYDALGALERGLIDEQMGATESLSAQVNRGLREARFEDIPMWMRNDMELMRIVTVGTLEEWSAGRIWNELSGTAGFAARFPAFDQIRRSLGAGAATITETVTKYLEEEDTLRLALRRYRGRSTDTSVEYLGEILKYGWSATEAVEVLEAENLLRSNPEMLDNLNAILKVSGMHALADTDMVDIMRGNAPTQVYEAINDSLRLQAMKKAGLTVDAELAASFGQGVAESVASAAEQGQYSTAAQQAALDLIQNWREVDLGKLGIGKDEIIQAAFGEGFAAQTEAKLLKFQRERQAAGAGWGGYSAYQGAQGQLVLSGLKQL